MPQMTRTMFSIDLLTVHIYVYHVRAWKRDHRNLLAGPSPGAASSLLRCVADVRGEWEDCVCEVQELDAPWPLRRNTLMCVTREHSRQRQGTQTGNKKHEHTAL
jgi:hypothetical protein